MARPGRKGAFRAEQAEAALARKEAEIAEARAAMVDWDEASTLTECGKAYDRMAAALAEKGDASDE